MIVSAEPSPFLVLANSPLSNALLRLDATKRRIVLVVERDGTLMGSLSDGDVRRWLVSHEGASLTAPVSEAMNGFCVRANQETPPSVLRGLLTGGVDLIPLVDTRGRVVGVAHERSDVFEISGHIVADDQPTFVIAEIGINHNGEMAVGRSLINAAAEAGATCAKFQMRNMESLYREFRSDDGSEDLGAEYTLDLLKESHLASEQILELMDYATAQGLVPLCTPWDLASAQILDEYGVPGFKVASADLTNHPLLSWLANTHRPLIVSSGMSTEEEIVQAVALLQNAASPFALLHCNSAYPAAFKDLNLRYMLRLAEIGDCPVGYSGHERGFHVAVAAVAMGARIIEKHITLDVAGRGNDHVVSLLPQQFSRMVREIRQVEEALGSDRPRTLTQGEQLNRLSLAKSLVAARDLSIGSRVKPTDISVRSPGRGLQPNRQQELEGRVIHRVIRRGAFFEQADLGETTPSARAYSVPRPWGIPVRFHDWSELARQSNPDFLEFHLSYRDMDSDFTSWPECPLPYGLVVHSPDLFRDDLILDLASGDEALRLRSIEELQRVIDLTRRLSPIFQQSWKPKVVVSMGGSSKHNPVTNDMRGRMYDRVAKSVSQLDIEGIQLLAQTLPPFPWYLGGQRYCNLFVDPVETAQFSQSTGIRLCLDVAHTKLACNHLHLSFSEAIDGLRPFTDHLHLVDATGVDGEGLQIGEGEIDWPSLCSQLRLFPDNVTFIPEIWQGHSESGAGFWTAMERIERLMSLAE